MPIFTVGDFKRVLRVYLVILEELVRGPLSLAHLSDPASEDTSPEAAEESLRWLQVLDAAITPARLRIAIQRLQPTELDVQATIRFLACKSPLEDEDRERLEFLSAFAFRARGGWEQPDSLTIMAQEIQHWLQDAWLDVSPAVADLLRQLEEVCQHVVSCTSFTELVSSRLIERGRTLKKACGSESVLPAVLAAVTGYNLSVGRHFDALLDQAAQDESFPRQEMSADYRKAGEEFRRWVDGKAEAVLPPAAVPATTPAVPASPVPERQKHRHLTQFNQLRGDPQAEEHNFQAMVSQVTQLTRAACEPLESIRLPNSTLPVAPWEFQSLVRDYPETERSFRVEVNCALQRTVGLLAAICEESTLFYVRKSSEYLWKKHLNSLAYLADLASEQLDSMQDLVRQAITRGLRMKAEQLAETTAKLESRLQEIAGLCEGINASTVGVRS